MKFVIEIPHETLTKLVEDIAIEQVKMMLREWALSPQARAAMRQQWSVVEKEILDGIFEHANVEAIKKSATERAARSLTGQMVRAAKARAKAIADREAL